MDSAEKILQNALEELGVSPLDREIYQICLDQYAISVTAIASELKVERKTVYSAIERLEIAGLIEKSEGRRKGVRVTPPRKITELLDRKKAELTYSQYQLEDRMSELLSRFAKTAIGGEVRFMKGKVPLLEVMDQMLSGNAESIMIVGDYSGLWSWLGQDEESKWNTKRIKKDIALRLLTSGTVPLDEVNKMKLKLETAEMLRLKKELVFIMGQSEGVILELSSQNLSVFSAGSAIQYFMALGMEALYKKQNSSIYR